MRSNSSGVTSVLILAILTGWLANPETVEAAPEPFSVGIVGDWGYTPEERARLPQLVDAMNRADLAFSVHDGDIKNGPTPCSDDVYHSTKRLFDRFDHPLVYTPGDNEWTDCWRSGFDPIERLFFLRTVFFSQPRSMGQRRMALRQQSGAYPENARWERGGVMFAAVHIVGSNNGLPDRERPGNRSEHAERNAAGVAWMRAAFAEAAARRSAGMMLFMQGDPLFEKPPGKRYGYDRFLAALAREVERFDGRVVLVHGDTHRYRVDRPALIGDPPRPSPRFTRVESFGPKEARWVQADIDVADPAVFRFHTSGPRR